MSRGQPLKSTEGLLKASRYWAHEETQLLLYRGHSRKSYKLVPAVLRNASHAMHEDVMFNELLASKPGDFAQDTTTLERLVRMQHYGLPTRLLDITSNPLIALYFACCSNAPDDGEIYIFKIDKSAIRYFDSDTATCFSNLARLDSASKAQIIPGLPDFSNSPPITKLLHYAHDDKPMLRPTLTHDDLKSVLCIRSKMSNDRVSSQAGAFLLFGTCDSLDDQTQDGISFGTRSISGGSKAKILRELDRLNINESTVFPSIERSAKYIAAKYRS